MIDPPTLELIKSRVAENPQAPEGIDRWRWCLVPASCREVTVTLERVSSLVTPGGEPVRSGEQAERTIKIAHRIPLQGARYVTHMRFGFAPEAEIVAYCVE